MGIKLKEDPRAWRNFTLQVGAILATGSGWFAWRHVISLQGWIAILAVVLGTSLLAWVRPQRFRGFYRAGMLTSAWLGERMGRVVLTVFFFLLMAPLGWLLRLTGYDPLYLKKPASANTYWRTAGKTGGLDRLY